MFCYPKFSKFALGRTGSAYVIAFFLEMIPLCVAISGLVLVCTALAQEQSSSVENIRDLTARELVDKFADKPKHDRVFQSSKPQVHSEAILRELMNRGDDGLRPLQSLYQRVASGIGTAGADDERSLQSDLGLLTALRHLQGKAPPLTIRVVGAAETIKGKTRELPILNVEVVNTDAMEQPVRFKFGGDYRSGRLARWRIHVWDEHGNQLPVVPRMSSIGGGIYSNGNLAFGDRDSCNLDIASFVRIPNSGKYKVQVMYHNSVSIADIERPNEIEELIVLKSQPFELVVEKGPLVTIELTNEDQERADSLISELDFESIVKMIKGEYTQFYHEFIPPLSAHGQLLAMRMRAIPALLERLKKPGATFEERGWMLAILDSILNEQYLCPTAVDYAMPSYKCKFPGGHCSMTTPRDKYSLTAQDQLVREWVDFAEDYIVVKR